MKSKQASWRWGARKTNTFQRVLTHTRRRVGRWPAKIWRHTQFTYTYKRWGGEEELVEMMRNRSSPRRTKVIKFKALCSCFWLGFVICEKINICHDFFATPPTLFFSFSPLLSSRLSFWPRTDLASYRFKFLNNLRRRRSLLFALWNPPEDRRFSKYFTSPIHQSNERRRSLP